jgi:hypothetical protein
MLCDVLYVMVCPDLCCRLVPVCSKSDPVDSVGVLQKTKPNFVCTSDEIQRHGSSAPSLEL